MVPDYIWLIFFFALGASIGSFLNVVVYRLPLDLSLVKPDSHCPVCKKPIVWYDNIPVFAWFLLRGRCRKCHTPFSFRYSFIELLTALLFAGLYWLYFMEGVREEMPVFTNGGWTIYIGHLVLVSCLLASSLIDAEHWIIPLSLSYTATIAGLILGAWSPVVIDPAVQENAWRVMPYAGPQMAACAFGAVIGLVIGMLLVQRGIIPRSYAALDEAQEQFQQRHELKGSKADGSMATSVTFDETNINDRKEMLWELLFLLPVVGLGLLCLYISRQDFAISQWWQQMILEQRWLAGFLGSVFGFLIGGGVVWGTRIGGTLAFGKEAMGLGDVHLMAAVGAVTGWITPTIAFFVAPFMGLGWALTRLIMHRKREIPYGPFLSAATVFVMIFHDQIVDFFRNSMISPQMIP